MVSLVLIAKNPIEEFYDNNPLKTSHHYLAIQLSIKQF